MVVGEGADIDGYKLCLCVCLFVCLIMADMIS